MVTGRTADGRWLELDAPGHRSAPVWVPVEHIDVAPGELPVRGCAMHSSEAATGPEDPTTDLQTPRSIASRSRPGPPSTSGAPRGSLAPVEDGPGAAGPGTTTTTTGEVRLWDRDAPEVRQLRAGTEVPDGPDEIFDDAACGRTTVTVEAVVVDRSPIRSVTVHWSFDGPGGQVAGSAPMHPSGGAYAGELGPFPDDSAGDAAAVTIRWWVLATDKPGNVGRADAPDGSDAIVPDERVSLRRCVG